MDFNQLGNQILKNIGRIHTYEDFLNCYEDAKKVGFQNINVDLMLALPNQTIKVTLNNQNYTKITDLEGKAIVNLSDLTEDSFITISYDGSDNYNSVLKTNLITISNKTNTVFVDSGLSISDIQNIFDNALNESNVEFLGSSYSDISLNINKSLNIYSSNNSILNAKLNTPVFIILSGDVNVSGFSINGNSADAIIIQNANNVSILNNNISNTLDESKYSNFQMKSNIFLIALCI